MTAAPVRVTMNVWCTVSAGGKAGGGMGVGGLNYTLEKISFLKNNKEEKANTLKEKGGKRGEGGREEGERERNREGERGE